MQTYLKLFKQAQVHSLYEHCSVKNRECHFHRKASFNLIYLTDTSPCYTAVQVRPSYFLISKNITSKVHCTGPLLVIESRSLLEATGFYPTQHSETLNSSEGSKSASTGIVSRLSFLFVFFLFLLQDVENLMQGNRAWS